MNTYHVTLLRCDQSQGVAMCGPELAYFDFQAPDDEAAIGVLVSIEEDTFDGAGRGITVADHT